MPPANPDPAPTTVAGCMATRDRMRLAGDTIRRLLAGEITSKEADAIIREANRKLAELGGQITTTRPPAT